jgi:hypothetical protein
MAQLVCGLTPASKRSPRALDCGQAQLTPDDSHEDTLPQLLNPLIDGSRSPKPNVLPCGSLRGQQCGIASTAPHAHCCDAFAQANPRLPGALSTCHPGSAPVGRVGPAWIAVPRVAVEPRADSCTPTLEEQQGAACELIAKSGTTTKRWCTDALNSHVQVFVGGVARREGDTGDAGGAAWAGGWATGSWGQAGRCGQGDSGGACIRQRVRGQEGGR